MKKWLVIVLALVLLGVGGILFMEGRDADSFELSDLLFVEPREHDLPMTIPSGIENEADNDFTLQIRVIAGGQFKTNLEAENLNLVELSQLIREFSTMCQATSEMPVVQLYAEPECKQQQVIDVLNAVREANISAVTFTEVDPEKAVKK